MKVWPDVVGYLFILVCGVGSFLLGVSTNLFGLIQDPTQAGLASLGVSLLILLTGDRITCGLRDREEIRQIDNVIKAAVLNVPLLNMVLEFQNCNDAQEYLCTHISNATAVFNTRISDTGVLPRDDIESRWAKTIAKKVKTGMVFKDIVSPAFEGYARNMSSLCSGSPGKYEYVVLGNTPPSYLNFVVVEYPNGDEEVLIGWATSVYRGMEQRAYRIRDKRVIAYFREYHGQLFMLTKTNAS